jgi:hypothetical protein
LLPKPSLPSTISALGPSTPLSLPTMVSIVPPTTLPPIPSIPLANLS